MILTSTSSFYGLAGRSKASSTKSSKTAFVFSLSLPPSRSPLSPHSLALLTLHQKIAKASHPTMYAWRYQNPLDASAQVEQGQFDSTVSRLSFLPSATNLYLSHWSKLILVFSFSSFVGKNDCHESGSGTILSSLLASTVRPSPVFFFFPFCARPSLLTNSNPSLPSSKLFFPPGSLQRPPNRNTLGSSPLSFPSRSLSFPLPPLHSPHLLSPPSPFLLSTQ